MNRYETVIRLSAVLVMATLLLAGCVKMGGGSSSNLPWSQPAEWENQTLGIPL